MFRATDEQFSVGSVAGPVHGLTDDCIQSRSQNKDDVDALPSVNRLCVCQRCVGLYYIHMCTEIERWNGSILQAAGWTYSLCIFRSAWSNRIKAGGQFCTCGDGQSSKRSDISFLLVVFRCRCSPHRFLRSFVFFFSSFFIFYLKHFIPLG